MASNEPDAEAVAIGRAVKGAIVTAGRTQAEVSERAEIPLKTLSRRISGEVPFTFPELIRVARVLRCSLADLTDRAQHILAAQQRDDAFLTLAAGRALNVGQYDATSS